MSAFKENQSYANNNPNSQTPKINHIGIIIGYVTILTLSILGWMFSEAIEEFLIGAGYSYFEDWIWGICFATSAGLMSIGLPRVIKMVYPDNKQYQKVQKKFVSIIGFGVLIGFLVFLIGFLVS